MGTYQVSIAATVYEETKETFLEAGIISLLDFKSIVRQVQDTHTQGYSISTLDISNKVPGIILIRLLKDKNKLINLIVTYLDNNNIQKRTLKQPRQWIVGLLWKAEEMITNQKGLNTEELLATHKALKQFLDDTGGVFIHLSKENRIPIPWEDLFAFNLWLDEYLEPLSKTHRKEILSYISSKDKNVISKPNIQKFLGVLVDYAKEISRSTY